jgi:hypothetical protein
MNAIKLQRKRNNGYISSLLNAKINFIILLCGPNNSAIKDKSLGSLTSSSHPLLIYRKINIKASNIKIG